MIEHFTGSCKIFLSHDMNVTGYGHGQPSSAEYRLVLNFVFYCVGTSTDNDDFLNSCLIVYNYLSNYISQYTLFLEYLYLLYTLTVRVCFFLINFAPLCNFFCTVGTIYKYTYMAHAYTIRPRTTICHTNIFNAKRYVWQI